MTLRSTLVRALQQEDLNFLLTNRIPRRLATHFLGWFSKIEQPLVARVSIAVWKLFADVDLSDAAADRYASLHHGFTRALRPGARAFDPDPAVIASPCDAIVGAWGPIEDGTLHQIKGFPYSLAELTGDARDAFAFEGGTYVTLRLTAGMYHRFHAPQDLVVEQVRYMSGDCWNVNPIALKRVERLFCRNERAALHLRLAEGGEPIALVAVAAVLVASIRLTFVNTTALLRAGGPRCIPLSVGMKQGTEMGWFEHGSTIVLLAPPGFMATDALIEGARIDAGLGLLRRID